MKALRERYVGSVADQYEAKRASTDQWRLEEAALCEVLEAARPATVLDVPCGTGRFWPVYFEMGIDAAGYDISGDMLHQARERGWVDIEQRSVFDVEGSWDLAVCFRFLNWLERGDCVRALEVLRDAAPAVVCSIGIGPGRGGRTILHDDGVFADAGLSISAMRRIRPGYYVVTAERA